MVHRASKIPSRRHNSITMKIVLVHTPFDWKRPITTLPHLIRKVAGVFNNHGSFEIDGKIYESDISGVVEIPLSEWKKNQTITIYEYKDLGPAGHPIPKVVEMTAKNLVRKHKYDFLSLFVWQPIYLATGWYLGYRNHKASQRFYCFEYLAYCMGIENWYKITPKEFNQWCDKYLTKTHANIKIHDYIESLKG